MAKSEAGDLRDALGWKPHFLVPATVVADEHRCARDI
jgi:hypothetical protein